jgi:energy-coupling factor transporter ATP-binding protein EcfA2
MIEVRQLRKSFDGFEALRGLDIRVPRGAVYGLVGPNGAGKSTVIRHIAGVYRQDGGEVLVGGEPVYENPAVKAKIAYIPDDIFFRQLMEGENGNLFVTKYRDKVIACAACVYSQGDAYLWYSAFRRKTYHTLHPDTMVVWDVMKHAYNEGYQHMRFMDVGLPFQKNPYREFILRFGGKEQSTYRWFRFSIRWVNKLLAWIYRE